MKSRFVPLALVVLFSACNVDVDSALDQLVDAIENDAETSCRVMLANGGNGNGRGDPHDDDVESEDSSDDSDFETIENDSETDDCESYDDSDIADSDDQESEFDTSGGIETHETYSDTGEDVPEFDDDAAARFFVGTFQLSLDTTCNQDYAYSGSGASAPEIPPTVRVWSNVYANTLDFELSNGMLGWFGELYQDQTIDFTIQYLNAFGQPSEFIDCTCQYEEAYYGYSSDQIDCLCEPSMANNDCTIRYNKI